MEVLHSDVTATTVIVEEKVLFAKESGLPNLPRDHAIHFQSVSQSAITAWVQLPH